MNLTARLFVAIIAAGLVAFGAASADDGADAADVKERSVQIKEGTPARDFTLPSSEGGAVALSALRGKIVVLDFHPKDDTPGCTKEVCSFRDANKDLQRLGAVVLGVSRNSLDSHGKFAARYKVPFPLLSNQEGKVHDLYGAWKQSSIFGRSALGVDRSTFLIDKSGVIRRIWRSAWPSRQAAGRSPRRRRRRGFSGRCGSSCTSCPC